MSQQLEVQLSADTSQYTAGITQAVTLTQQQMRTLASYVKAANDAQAQLGRTAQQAAATATTSYKAVTEGAQRMAAGHAGVNRELLVLAHEMSQGNFTRFGGSLLVLGERMDVLSKIASGTGLAVGALGAVLLGTVALIAKGAIDSAAFAKQLELTGNYAGTTQAQIEALAASQAKLTGRTQGAAHDTLQAVAGSGLFTPDTFAAVARAMGDYQKVSGATADEALKDFARMKDGVARWASELNQTVHFLTLTQYEHIKAIEDAGQADQAAAEAAAALSSTLEGRATPAVGLFARAWQNVKEAASSAAQWIENIGRPADKVASQIAAIDQQIALVKQANTANPGAASDTLAALQEQRRQLQTVQAQIAGDRAAKAQGEQMQAAAIKAKDYTDAVLRSAKALSARNEELAKFDAAVKAQAAAGKPLAPEDVAAGRAEIIKRFTPPDVSKSANEYAELTARVKEFSDATNIEEAGLAKVTDGQRFVLEVQKALASSARALTQAQRESILADAQSAGVKRDNADRAIADAKAQVHAIAEIASAQAKADANRDALVGGVAQAGQEQITALYRQMQQIGRSTADIFKLDQLQRFDDAVGKALLGADGEGAKRILQTAGVIRGDLVRAIDDAKAAQDKWNASFENGFGAAFRDYAEQAKNAAAGGAQVFQDGVRGMTDAIVGFATTGKLSFKNFADSVIQDLLRIETQKLIASTLSNIGSASGAAGGILGNFGALFGVNFGVHANGKDYVPYDGYPAILHEGEKVLTKQDATRDRNSRGGVHIDASTRIGSIGAGVNASEMNAALARSQAQSEARIRRLLRNGSVATA